MVVHYCFSVCNTTLSQRILHTRKDTCPNTLPYRQRRPWSKHEIGTHYEAGLGYRAERCVAGTNLKPQQYTGLCAVGS